MSKPIKQITVRLSPTDFAAVQAAAHRVEMSTNRYIVTASRAYATDTDQARRIAELVEQQTAAIAGELAVQFERAEAQRVAALADVVKQITDAGKVRDGKLRDDLNAALNRLAGRPAERGVRTQTATDATAEENVQ